MNRNVSSRIAAGAVIAALIACGALLLTRLFRGQRAESAAPVTHDGMRSPRPVPPPSVEKEIEAGTGARLASFDAFKLMMVGSRGFQPFASAGCELHEEFASMLPNDEVRTAVRNAILAYLQGVQELELRVSELGEAETGGPVLQIGKIEGMPTLESAFRQSLAGTLPADYVDSMVAGMRVTALFGCGGNPQTLYFAEEEAMPGRVVQTVRSDVWRPNGRSSTSLPPDSPMATLRYGKLTQRLRDLIGHK